MRTTLLPECPLRVIVTMGLALAGAEASADDIFWSNSSGGVFQSGDNWSGAIPPSPTDAAFFNLSSVDGYAVTFISDDETQRLVIRNDVLTLNLAGNIYTLNSPDLTSLVVGQSAGENGYLTLANGQLISVSSSIGLGGSSLGSVTVSGLNTTLNNAGDLVVGQEGDGFISAVAGAQIITMQNSVFGAQSGSVGIGTVNGTGSVWNSEGDFIVGNAGQGTLTVSRDARFFGTGPMVVGSTPAGVGEIEVIGTGSLLHINNAWTIGDAGVGSVLLAQGASSRGNSLVTIGAMPGSVGSFIVIGPETDWITGIVEVGGLGDGSLLVAGGASVQISGNIAVGREEGSAGQFTVTGDGSIVNTGGAVQVLSAGDASATVADGGLIFSEGSSVVGIGPGQTAQALVTDPGSSWISDSAFVVGTEGRGEVLVQNGGAVSSLSVTILGDQGGVGEITVTDPGSSWTVANSAFVVGAHESFGRLTIMDGATAFADFDTTIGDGSNAMGEIVVTGSGSNLTIQVRLDIGNTTTAQGLLSVTEEATVHIDGFAVIGFFGSGALELASGGSFSTTAQTFVAGQTESTADLSVLNSGSFLHIGGLFELGGNGQCVMTIADSGTVNVDGSSVMAANPSAVAEVIVTDAGSTWVSADELVVGSSGQATLLVKDNGEVSAPSVVIGTTGLVTGNSVLDGAVQNGGKVSPGVDTCSPAVFTINGNYAQDPVGGLIIELGGTVPGQEYDVLAISGDSILDGTLVLSLIDGFLPQVDQEFEILTASSVTGTFPQIIMPSSGQYEVSYESDSVLIRVTQSAILGDLNADGTIGVADLLILLANWGPCAQGCCSADLDLDGLVTVADLCILLANWG